LEFCWFVFCQWTPKPFNPWRLFWLRVFEAKIEGTPFRAFARADCNPVESHLHDRACLGDRANAYSLGEIEIGERATIAQEAYLSTGSHDFSQPSIPLTASENYHGADAFTAHAHSFTGRDNRRAQRHRRVLRRTENVPPMSSPREIRVGFCGRDEHARSGSVIVQS